MKNLLLIGVLMLGNAAGLWGQAFSKPAEGKTLVYFVRYQGAVALIDFSYYDGKTYLGRGGGNNYFTYECEPGEHVFWVLAENRAFIRGDLKPNATYVIEVRPFFRITLPGAELYQVSPGDKRALKEIDEIMRSRGPVRLQPSSAEITPDITRAWEWYEAKKDKVKTINPDKFF